MNTPGPSASRLPPYPPAWAEEFGEDRLGLFASFKLETVPFVFRWIPPGSFLMGSPDSEPGRDSDEGPRHEVVISKGFWLGETPVTQGQWAAVVRDPTGRPASSLAAQSDLKANSSHFQGTTPDISARLPVEQVSFHDVACFMARLRPWIPGLALRLASEAEWKYACRAGTETALHTGPITIKGPNHAPELDAIAWYGGNSGKDCVVKNPYDSKGWPGKQFAETTAGTHPVKGKEPNPWGLHDMLGNVREWCRDGKRKYQGRSEVDPVGPMDDGAGRVVRGGSWSNDARWCRAAYRDRSGPDDRGINLGFRLAAGQEMEERG